VGAGRAGARGTLSERARRAHRDAAADVILPHVPSTLERRRRVSRQVRAARGPVL
jgi:hypothetical protein